MAAQTSRYRFGTVLLRVAFVAVFATLAAFALWQASLRWRVDTAVDGVAVGSPGCVHEVAFTAPDGVEHRVPVWAYKRSCIDRDPGERINVWFDSSDPSVNAPDRSWWWPALIALALGGVAAALAVPERWRRRWSSRRRPPAPVAPDPDTVPRAAAAGAVGRSRNLPVVTPDDAHLYDDWTDGRLEVLAARSRAELALPVDQRSSSARDRSIEIVADGLERARVALRDGHPQTARDAMAGVAHMVLDEWDLRSDLAESILSLQHYVWGLTDPS